FFQAEDGIRVFHVTGVQTCALPISHMRCTSFDLPVVEPIAKRTIEAAGLSEHVTALGGDFFADPLPEADVITMGLILHDWNLEQIGRASCRERGGMLVLALRPMIGI